MASSTLQCQRCGWRTVCSSAGIVRRLRTAGLLRRASNPSEDVIRELLVSNLNKLACDHCQQLGLIGTNAADSNDDSDYGGDWQQAVVCEVCRKPIPPERVEIFPDARRCVACQDVADRGEDPDEPEFCEKCGALVELRVSRGGGITRYKRFCTGDPPCRL